MITNKELLKIQVKSLQSALPKKVLFRGEDIPLTKLEKMACGRAIWYIIQKGWGLGSAVGCASGSFSCSPSKVRRSVERVFPENYFTELEKQKNYILYDKLRNGYESR